MRPATLRRWSRAAWPAVFLIALAGCTSAGAPAAVPPSPLAAADTAAPASASTPSQSTTMAPSPPTPDPTVAPASPSAPVVATATPSSGGSTYNDGYGGGYGGYGAASPAAAASSTSASAAAATLATAEIAGVGTVLVGPGGLTLYTYTQDGPGVSTCTGACAQAWPPLVATAVPPVPTKAMGKFSLATRADGSRQVAYDGHPLYEYAGDPTPGVANGEGLGGVWHVAKP